MTRKCPECGRVFDLLDPDDAGEYAYGHDCEEGPSARPDYAEDDYWTAEAGRREDAELWGEDKS
jgi:hypothetical protein